MSNENSILLLGIQPNHKNRGIDALALSAIELLSNQFKCKRFLILQFSKAERCENLEIEISNGSACVEIHYFTKKNVLRFMLDLFLKKTGLRPNGKLYSFTCLCNQVFDANEGDSFSDIYGLKRFARHCLDSMIIIFSGKDLKFLPQTIGPFNTTSGRIIGKYVLSKVDKIYVRDTESQLLLKSMGLDCELSQDMAVFLKCEKSQETISRLSVAINVSGFLWYKTYGRDIKDFDAYRPLMEALLGRLIEENNEIVLIPHTYNVQNPCLEDDLSASKELLKQFGKERVRCIDKELNASELKGLISQASFFIGSRMHSCIAALSSGVPAVGISYSPKFKGTFNVFGQSDHVIELVDLNASEIPKVVDRILLLKKRSDLTRLKLYEVNSHMKRIVFEKNE